METGETSIWLSVFTLATVVLNFAYQWFSKGRERRWAQEAAAKLELDSKAAAAALAVKVETAAVAATALVAAQANAVAMTLASNATALAKEVTDTAKALAVKVEQGSDKAVEGSERAYTEANTVNLKIAALQEQNVKINETLVELSGHISGIVGTMQETAAATRQASIINKKVEEILLARGSLGKRSR